jgi:hypothetical protein
VTAVLTLQDNPQQKRLVILQGVVCPQSEEQGSYIVQKLFDRNVDHEEPRDLMKSCSTSQKVKVTLFKKPTPFYAGTNEVLNHYACAKDHRQVHDFRHHSSYVGRIRGMNYKQQKRHFIYCPMNLPISDDRDNTKPRQHKTAINQNRD